MANGDYNPYRRISPIVLRLIIINAIVFAATYLLPQLHIDTTFGLFYYKSPGFHFYQVVTYMFLHGSIEHILFNMFALWIFGTILENYWGTARFLIFYFVCGIFSAVVEQFFMPLSAMQIAKTIPLDSGV